MEAAALGHHFTCKVFLKPLSRPITRRPGFAFLTSSPAGPYRGTNSFVESMMTWEFDWSLEVSVCTLTSALSGWRSSCAIASVKPWPGGQKQQKKSQRRVYQVNWLEEILTHITASWLLVCAPE